MTTVHRPRRHFNVLFVTPLLGIGGEELSTLTLASELRWRGHTVSLLATPGVLAEECERRGVDISFGRVAGRWPLGVLAGASDLRTWVLEKQPDLIHAQSVVPTIMAFLATRSLGRERPKVIWHDRGVHEWSYPAVAKAFNLMADLVVANSDFERRRLVRNGLRSQHVRRIYNCVNLDFPPTIRRDRDILGEFGIPRDAFVVGSVSRLARTKGHEYLLRATRLLASTVPRLRLLLVGGGPLEDHLKRLAEHLGIGDLTTFAGFRRDVHAVYSSMDVLVMPSLREPFGNAALEAAAFGLPVVASNVEGLPEAVQDGRTGILVPPRDPARLAEAILCLAESPAMSRGMGLAGRNRVKQQFLPERVARDIEDTYCHVLGLSPHASE